MRHRRVRAPNRATAINKPIQRPDTYQRLPEDVQLNTCEQQPVHTFGLNTAELAGQKVDGSTLFQATVPAHPVRGSHSVFVFV